MNELEIVTGRANDQNMGVTPHSSVEAFFREVLVEALEAEGVLVSEPTEYYLVGLLGEFTRARITDEPLSVKLVEAPRDLGERVKNLKEVGDTSLYLTGFFRESLSRQLVKADYYMGLGESAYRQLARQLASSSVREVYEELAAKFPRFVDVLTQVRSQVHFASDDVVALDDEWVQTRSEWVEGRLRKLGVIVGGDDDGYVQ
jgi:hypothetical protein